MKDFTIESLIALKKAVSSGDRPQKVNVQVSNSFMVENYYERRKKYSDIKDYIESRIHGITVEVSGGYNKPDAEEPDGMRYDPIVITTYKNTEPNSFSRIKLDGFYIAEPTCEQMVYDNYLDILVNGSEYMEHGTISLWESVIKEALNQTFLSECGFLANGNELMLLKDEKCFTIISNISKEVDGVITAFLPGEDDPSLIIVCDNKVVLLSEDYFYIDATEMAVA